MTRTATLAALALLALPTQAAIIYSTGTDLTGTDPTWVQNKSAVVSKFNFGKYLVFAVSFSPTTDSIAAVLRIPLSKYSATGPFSTGTTLDFDIVNTLTAPDTDIYGNATLPLYSGEVTGITGATGTVYNVSLTGSVTLLAANTYDLLARIPGVNPDPDCSSTPNSCAEYDVRWYENPASAANPTHFSDYNGGGFTGVSSPPPAFTLDSTALTSSTPEPATFALFGGGLALGLFLKRKRNR